MIIKCKICQTENNLEQHYCKNCGKNLSNTIELTDILFVVSKILIILAYTFTIVTLIDNFLLNVIFKLSQDKARIEIKFYIIYLLIFIFGKIIKSYALKLCKKNL